jgi:hypothetical protein
LAELLREDEVEAEVSVISADDLLHTLRSQDREQILERLNNRTTKDIQREQALRRAAAARLAKSEHRSGYDRRSGRDRRSVGDWKPAGGERRSGRDRRWGRDRRTKTAAT